MGERRDQYRQPDRRDGGRRSRCSCKWCLGLPYRHGSRADLDAREQMHDDAEDAAFSDEELRLRNSVPKAYRLMPRAVLADYLEDRGRTADAQRLRRM